MLTIATCRHIPQLCAWAVRVRALTNVLSVFIDSHYVMACGMPSFRAKWQHLSGKRFNIFKTSEVTQTSNTLKSKTASSSKSKAAAVGAAQLRSVKEGILSRSEGGSTMDVGPNAGRAIHEKKRHGHIYIYSCMKREIERGTETNRNMGRQRDSIS